MTTEAEATAIKRQIDPELQAVATLVKTRANGEAERVQAEGTKAAEVLCAEGSRQAAGNASPS